MRSAKEIWGGLLFGVVASDPLTFCGNCSVADCSGAASDVGSCAQCDQDQSDGGAAIRVVTPSTASQRREP